MAILVPPYPLIRDGLHQGRVIPFLGSGASLGERGPNTTWDKKHALCMPTATELAHYLADRTAFPPDETLDLAKVAQYYSVVGGRGPLDQELRDIFGRDYPLTSLHSYLASVSAPLLIVTTNYDDLIERAFDACNHAYDVVIHTTDPAIGDRVLWRQHGCKESCEIIPNKLDIDLQKTNVVYKIHGAVDRHNQKRDQFVITEDDYVDFLVRMTKNKAIPAIFAEPFQTCHFLFLGYSLRDWNLRVVLNRIEKDLRRPRAIKSWAIQYKPSSLERRFWQERGVEVYEMTTNEFVKNILVF